MPWGLFGTLNFPLIIDWIFCGNYLNWINTVLNLSNILHLYWIAWWILLCLWINWPRGGSYGSVNQPELKVKSLSLHGQTSLTNIICYVTIPGRQSFTGFKCLAVFICKHYLFICLFGKITCSCLLNSTCL